MCLSFISDAVHDFMSRNLAHKREYLLYEKEGETEIEKEECWMEKERERRGCVCVRERNI